MNSLKKYGSHIGAAMLLLCTIILLTNTSMTLIKENNFIRKLKSKLSNYNRAIPEDRLYVHTDKTLYQPGETIWFKTYVRNGKTLKPSGKSEIVMVDIINPKGAVESTINIIAKDGSGEADFTLLPSAPGGVYKLKAYTQFQKNEFNDSSYEKEIQVQKVVLPRLKMKLDFQEKAYGPSGFVTANLSAITLTNEPLADNTITYVVKLAGKEIMNKTAKTDKDGKAQIQFELPKDLSTSDGLLNVMLDHRGSRESIARSIPIALSNVALNFFPESGDMIAGLENNVAFAALNEFGKPADVKGKIYDNRDQEVGSFKSYHNGMGAFQLKPQTGKSYYAKITSPAGINEEYKLPEMLDKGFALSVSSLDKQNLILKVLSTQEEEVSLIAQVRSQHIYSDGLMLKQGENEVVIPLSDFPQGVAQFTLFDSKEIERAERLVFINKDQYLNVDIKTNKEEYLPREKVQMSITVKDERGMGMPADLSLAVVDDKLLSYADDKQGNILSTLLLQSDLDSKVEEADFYFDKEEAKAPQALDYLMMTKGWRRFVWKQIMDSTEVAINFKGQKAIVGGYVFDANGKKVPGADIRIVVEQDSIRRASTNSEGKFYITGLDLSQPTELHISADGHPDTFYPVGSYGEEIKIRMENRPEVMAMMAEAAPGGVRKNRMRNAPAGAPVMEMDDAVEFNAVGGADAADAEVLEEDAAGMMDGDMEMPNAKRMPPPRQHNQPKVAYHRVREFPLPEYDPKKEVKKRNDFRTTVFWKGNLELDESGKAEIEFYNGDAISSFRAVAEGISADGTPGRGETTFFTRRPISVDIKIPVGIAMGDNIAIGVVIENNLPNDIKGVLKVNRPEVLEPFDLPPKYQLVKAGQTKTVYLSYEVLNMPGQYPLSIFYDFQGYKDEIEQEINIVPRGFPISESFSARELEKEYRFSVSNLVEESMSMSVSAYPSVTTELLAGVESILREPHGCFEQTSMSSYPNVLVLRYLKENDHDDPTLMAKAEELLDKGYKKLVTFETPEKGYEWFGGAPGHEALTAYGLMQFNEMKKVYPDFDEEMLERTANWLMSRRDGNGLFLRNEKALDSFGRANEDVTNAYIVYSLSEAGYKDIITEFDTAFGKAKTNQDPYQLALIAGAAFNLKQSAKGIELLTLLEAKRAKDNSWTGSTHSVTYSQGKSLTIETTSLAILAFLKSPEPNIEMINGGIEYLIGSRSGRGGFGSTQGTVLALKALTEYATFAQQTEEPGTIEVYVEGKKVDEFSYKKGHRAPIVLDGLEEYVKSSKPKVKVKFKDTDKALPYTLAVDYFSSEPDASDDCKVSIQTNLVEESKVGKTARLSTTIMNKTEEGLPMTVAIVGIPGGLSAQPYQLKELQEKKVFDFYEITDNQVYFYYRSLEPSAVKEINLDLKADIVGDFQGQASSAYLYYTNEHKAWSSPTRIYVAQ